MNTRVRGDEWRNQQQGKEGVMPSKAKRARTPKPKPRGKARDKGSREATKPPETTTERAETTQNNDDRGAV